METKRHYNWDELVFENKNKEYGAYFLRKKYNKSILIAASFGILIMLLVVVPVYISQYEFLDEEMFMVDNTVTVDLMNLEDLNTELPPPPELPTLEDTKKESKNSIEVVDSVTKPETIPTNDQLKDSIVNEMVEEDSLTKSSQSGTAGAYGYYTIEEKPEFPGGQPALYKWLPQNINYPQAAQDKGIKGKVIVQFIIDTEGNVTNVEIIHGVHVLLDNEAMRIIKSMPKWKPGRQKGKPVKVLFQIPINFTFYK